MCSWKCLVNALILSESPMIKILVLTLRSLDLGIPSSARFFKLVLSSRALPLFQSRPSSPLIKSLDLGEFV